MANAAGLFLLSALFWLGAGVLCTLAVSAAAWTGLYAVCGVAALVLWASELVKAKILGWMCAAHCAVLLAAFCYGVNGGLDALYGIHRHRSHPEDRLGGLELWFMLCQGAASVALAGAARSLLFERSPLVP